MLITCNVFSLGEVCHCTSQTIFWKYVVVTIIIKEYYNKKQNKLRKINKKKNRIN